MIPFLTDGNTAPFQMTDSPLKHILFRPVVERQTHTDLFDHDISHDAGAAELQRLLIALCFFGASEGILILLEPPVIIPGLLKNGSIIFRSLLSGTNLS